MNCLGQLGKPVMFVTEGGKAPVPELQRLAAWLLGHVYLSALLSCVRRRRNR